ncbi:MAG TPA: DUF5906 domain-containing protein [Xanthobacteraceae bacterium]|nr:DUF5906 domain-containing protein [Xanthobacteraceae bacterium]
MSESQIKKLKQKLLSQSEQLLAKWFSNGKRVRDEWVVGNLANEAGESLKINIKSGRWCDFALPELKGGDLISLYAAKQNISYSEAVRQLSSEVGNTAIVPVPRDVPDPGLREGQQHPRRSDYAVTNWWAYRDADNQLVAYVVRFDSKYGKKQLLPLSYFLNEGWRWKGIGKRYPVYGSELLTARPDHPVILVEGEKTATAAREIFPDHVVVTWHGGVNRIAGTDWTILKDRHVVYWPDADVQGKETIPLIAEVLASAAAASLHVVDVPLELPKGWDLADIAPDHVDVGHLLFAAREVRLSHAQKFVTLDEKVLVQRLIFVAETTQFFDIESGRRYDQRQLKLLFLHIDRSLPNRLLENDQLRKVQAYCYRPGIEERILVDEVGTSFLNLWIPSRIIYEEGDASPFIEHLSYLCSSESEFEHLADMLAFMVQRQGEKLKSAIVLVGLQGTGKSFVGSVMTKILGAENTASVTSTEIKSNFNDWIEAKQLVRVEEIMALGKLEITNHLKPLITEERTRINTKHQRTYELENKANFIFFTNYVDALKLEKGDRRYFVIVSDNPPQDADYYKKLWDWADASIGIIANWLKGRDISGFNPNACPPETEGKLRMIEAGRGWQEAWVAEKIEAKEAPFEHDLIEVSSLRLRIRELSTASELNFSQPQLLRALRAAGATQLGQKKGTVGGREMRVSPWAVRNIEKYRSLSPYAIVEEYARAYGLYNSEEGKRLIG